MARTVATLPKGTRITDFISLGVLHQQVPEDRVRNALTATGRASQRSRDLPAHVMVYYVMALALYMDSSSREVLRCLLEGFRWLFPRAKVKVAGKPGISQARSRLGWEPLLALYDDVVGPVATEETRGAWYRGWRVVSLDGSTLDLADTPSNEEVYGRHRSGRGRTAFPHLRFVALVENGTHVLFGARCGAYRTHENTLAREVLPFLREGMLCLADRGFFGFDLWKFARGTKADLVWRVNKRIRLDCVQRLPDGSFLSEIYPSAKDRAKGTRAERLRVVEYTLRGSDGSEILYRLATSVLDPAAAPAAELAALYEDRWEIETAFDELKTHLRGRGVVLRSKTPDLAKQEFYGLLLAHYAVRGLMHEAALKAREDPDRLSFIHAIRVVRRKIPRFVSFPPSGTECPS